MHAPQRKTTSEVRMHHVNATRLTRQQPDRNLLDPVFHDTTTWSATSAATQSVMSVSPCHHSYTHNRHVGIGCTISSAQSTSHMPVSREYSFLVGNIPKIELLQMVQRMTDSTFNGYRLPSNESGSGNQDKQPILPVTAKKTPLRDLQNEIRTTVPNIRESSLFTEESGPAIEASKACCTKRPTPECLMSPPNFKSLTSSAPNEPLVYVRRRPDTELLAKSTISDNTSNNAHFPQEERKLAGNDERTEQKSHVKEHKVCAPEIAPITRASLTCFSSGKPSVSPPADFNNHPTSYAIPKLNYPKAMHSQHWEERYCQLRELLKVLNQSNQEDYMQMLRSLSPVELSRYAVELEKRSIELSLEEAKEIQRVQHFNVLGKYPKISRAP